MDLSAIRCSRRLAVAIATRANRYRRGGEAG